MTGVLHAYNNPRFTLQGKEISLDTNNVALDNLNYSSPAIPRTCFLISLDQLWSSMALKWKQNFKPRKCPILRLHYLLLVDEMLIFYQTHVKFKGNVDGVPSEDE